MSQPIRRYPGPTWEYMPLEGNTRWDTRNLQEARAYADSIGSAAVVVIDDGMIVADWGNTARPYNCHSIRKSLLSGLYGIHISEGRIQLTQTLAELDIDDCDPALTPAEKQATVADLLTSRSGVYHWANYQSKSDRSFLPARGMYAPGTYFIYNNWDFNALGTIFERCTQTGIFEEFARRIATPLQLEDFQLDEQEYVGGPDSIHPAYVFRLSARDLARYGLLYLRHGRWDDQQVIPAQWITDSTTAHARARDGRGYGYLWWVAVEGVLFPNVVVPDGSYAAFAVGGHYMMILPQLELIVVHRYDTDVEGFWKTAPSPFQQGELLRLLLAARVPDAAHGDRD